MHYLPISQSIATRMKRGRGAVDTLAPKGRFVAKHYRDGNLIGSYEFPNAVKNTAKNNILDVFFNSATHSTTWCIGLVDNSTYSSDPTSDTMASHAGWTEFTSYTVGSSDSTHRGTWGQGSASGQSVTNSSACVFTFTGSGTVWGIFVTTNNTKGNFGSGLLWSTAGLSAPIPVLSSDVLDIIYTVSL